MTMIELSGVRKSFHGTEVLHETTTVFPDGKITGICGPNGSGKTVLLKLICGFFRPTSGSIRVGNETIGKDVDFPSDIGAVIETASFLSWQTGEECLLELAKIRHRIGKAEVAGILEQMGLANAAGKHIGRYSLGMRQRLALAQAFMEDPMTIILDEPFNALDKEGVKLVKDRLTEFAKRGRTIVVCDHVREEMLGFCDALYEMENGTLKRIEMKEDL